MHDAGAWADFLHSGVWLQMVRAGEISQKSPKSELGNLKRNAMFAGARAQMERRGFPHFEPRVMCAHDARSVPTIW